MVAAAPSQKIDLRVWIISAGYGLIRLDAPIMSYAASFSVGPDQVVSTEDAPRWWEALAEWNGPGFPRTIEGLAKLEICGPLMVVASAPYVKAILGDFAGARKVLSDEAIGLISTGYARHESMESVHLPGDDRFLSDRGGTAHTLNVKLASWALETFHEWKNDFSILHASFKDRLGKLAARDHTTGTPNTDADVKAFIEERLSTDPKAYTVLLREFRGRGRACEQLRFKQIYSSVAGQERE